MTLVTLMTLNSPNRAVRGRRLRHPRRLPQPPGRTCAQCRLGDGELEPERDGGRLVWLHRECRRFSGRRSHAPDPRSALRAIPLMTSHKQSSEQSEQ